MGKKERKITLKYVNINNLARIELELSFNEYVFSDMVYHLSTNPKSRKPGWCTMGKEDLGINIDVSRRSAISISKKLIEKGILEQDEEGHLRTTEKWYKNVIIFSREESSHIKNEPCKESSHPPVKKVHRLCEESSHNINIDINRNKKEESKEEIAPSQISVEERKTKIKQLLDNTEKFYEDLNKRKEDIQQLIEKTDTATSLNTKEERTPSPHSAPPPSPKFFELYCGQDKEPISAIENQIMRLISNQQFNANDWPEIERHISGYFERTAKVGDETTKKPYRKRAINYLKSQEWLMNPNPIKDATILPSRKKESKVLPPRKQRFG